MNPDDDYTVPGALPPVKLEHTDEEIAAALDLALREPAQFQPPAPSPRRYIGTTPVDENGKPTIFNLSHTHEAVMNWMIANPHLPLRDCAAHFGYTQSWLSLVIHSDLFKVAMKKKQEAVFSMIAAGTTEKVQAIADIGLGKIAEELETSTDKRFILESTKTALSALGFGAANKAPTAAINAQNVQQNFYVASRDDLVAARGIMAKNGMVSDVPSLDAPGSATSLQNQET